MNKQNLSPVKDLSAMTFDELFSRFQSLDTECLLVYLFDKVEESALIHLAEQFHITGNEGWANCTTIGEKRDLIKNSLNLHRYRGTRFSLLRVLEILGLNGQLQEWFEYGGKPYHFKISIDMNNKAFDETTEKSLTDLIDANKNVRSKLEAFQIWQVYRNRWCAAYWQSKGIKVIPTISWSDEASYKYAFLGIPKNSVVAIGTVGVVNDKNAERLFMQGFKEMLKQLEPKRILIYGNRLTELEGYKNLQWFEPYTNKWNKKKGR